MDGIEFVLVQPDRSLNFPAVDRIRTKISEATSLKIGQIVGSDNAVDMESVKTVIKALPLPVILDLKQVVDMDFSAATALRALAKSISGSGQVILFCGASQNVENVLQGVDASLFLSHVNVEEAVRCLTRS